MKKLSKVSWRFFIALIFMVTLSTGTSASVLNDSNAELEKIKKDFAPVLNLKAIAKGEINAIANLLAPGSKLAAIDITNTSDEYCMLEKVTKHNMIHYSSRPEKTHEAIVYYLNPKTFIENGLDVSKLPRQPKELGKMLLL